ncbi:MAG: pyridoxamine 5'-phosphate oxidase family protein [Solirubrobacteraceae bacterium]
MFVIAVDVGVQRAGVNDQRDEPTCARMISSIRSEISDWPLCPAPAAQTMTRAFRLSHLSGFPRTLRTDPLLSCHERAHIVDGMKPAHANTGSTDDGSTEADEHAGPQRRLETLERAECLRLLASSDLGRVVVAMPSGAPVIRPVNYVFDEGSQSVLISSFPGSKLFALTHARQATFEVDSVDPAQRSGWSVIITGVVEEVTRPNDLDRSHEQAIDPWVSAGEASRLLRIRAYTVSGRRIA